MENTIKIKDAELWNYFKSKSVANSHPFDRDSLWVLDTDFQTVKHNLQGEYNILHPGKSFRSNGFFRHIHAVCQGDYVFIHRDTGNMKRFLPLRILHFFLDVLPYILFALFKRKSLIDIFDPPKCLFEK